MNHLIRKAVLTALVLLVAAPAVAGSWTIDPAHSVMNFKVRHIFSRTGGSFDRWEGTMSFDGENPASLAAEISIEAASINTDNESRDEHLRGEDFFDVEKYPAIHFISTSAEQRDGSWVLVGNLTMHGVTKEVAIDFEFHGAGLNPWGQTVAGFSGSLVVNRKDFGIEWNKSLDAGGAVLGDEISIDLEVEAAEQGDAR